MSSYPGQPEQPSKAAVKRAAATFAKLYGRSHSWADQLVGGLEVALRGASDAAVDAAVAAWIDGHPDDAPTPAQVRALVRAQSPASGDTGIAGCGQCSAEGYREVVLHLRSVHGDAPGFAVVRAVLCDCGRGAYWSRRRGQSRGDEPSQGPEIQLARYLQEWRDRPLRQPVGRPGVRLERYIVDPTPGQRVGEDVRRIAEARAAQPASARTRLERGTEVARRAHHRAGLSLADDDRLNVEARANAAFEERADLDDRPEPPVPDDRAAWMGAADGDDPLDGPLY